jgi:hypothetical protein
MEAAKFNLEIQSVVSMRLMKIAAGGAEAAAEWRPRRPLDRLPLEKAGASRGRRKRQWSQ